MRVVEPIDDMSIVTEGVSLAELKTSAERRFGDMVKAVVDISTRTSSLVTTGSSSTR